jgi:uncharacterized membrane protein
MFPKFSTFSKVLFNILKSRFPTGNYIISVLPDTFHAACFTGAPKKPLL